MDGGAGNDDFEAGGVGKVCFGRLGMVMAAVPDCHGGHADGKAADVEFVAGTVSVLGCFIYNL